MSTGELAALVAGALIVAYTIGSAVVTVILPRAVHSGLARGVFAAVRGSFRLLMGRHASFERADRLLALFPPVGFLVLAMTWLTMLAFGYSAIYFGLGVRPFSRAVVVSGSSLLTLGFESPGDLPAVVTSFTEGALGLVVLALLIAFLPTLYTAFSRREQFVAFLEVRAGSPPSAREMLTRLWSIGRPAERLEQLWERAEAWFLDVEETHTSFPALIFFRSPQPKHSWVTAAGAVLDTAALVASTVDLPRNPDTDLSIRAGYIALRRIAAQHDIAFDPDPRADDPISIMRAEYDEVVEALARGGVPVKADREQAWRDFAGWRVNYDAALLGIASLVSAPPAPWISDRDVLAHAHRARPRRRARAAG